MLNKADIKLLKLMDTGNVYWSRREGGSEPYQIYRNRVHELVAKGYAYEFSKKSCCLREYGLTQKGKEVLQNECG